MRYRPFGRAGAAVSCLSLVLTDHMMRDDDRVRLIYAALESGVNTFELQTRDPNAAAVLGEALSAVERRMVFVGLRIGWSRDSDGRRVADLSVEGVRNSVDGMLARTRLGRLDVALLDVPEDLPVPPETLTLLQEMRTSGRVRMLGVAGGDATDRHLDSGLFDVLATGFNIKSGWRERNRLKRAFQADMPIIGCDYQPFTPGAEAERVKPAGPLGLGRLLGGGAPKAVRLAKSPYAFLEDSNGWTAEEICLGYALTEPSLTTVQTATQDPDHLHRLALVADRDLPTGISAQIEMARFSESASSGAA